MELMIEEKKGFKRTELGEFPEDWVVKPINECTNYVDYRGATPKKVDYGITLVTAKNIKKGYIDYSDSKEYVEPENYDEIMSRGKPEIGDILITTEAPLGNVAAVDNKNIALAQRVIKYRAIESFLDNDYLKYFFLSDRFQENLYTNSSGSTATGIKGSVLHKLPICFPPTLTEQQAIASALSDVDELIRSLDGLIQKKQAIKKGTMQLLLSGKKRLPGFDGEWVVKTLGDLCSDINDGTHYTPKYVENGVPFYSVENVVANNLSDVKYITREEHRSLIKRCKPETGDILLTRIGTLAITKLIDWDIDASIYVSLALLKPNENIESTYLYSYTKSDQFVEDVKKRSLTNATPQKINMGEIPNVPIHLPTDRNEQLKIGQILLDLEQELQTLGQKREKYVQIKQGMLQKLLTGKVRLVKQEATIHQMPRKRSENFEDAVLIAAVINRFGSGDFKLNRFRYQKFVYLLKRYVKASTEHYMKKTAGPYNPNMRYRGGESVAIKEGYIEEIKHNGYDCFTTGNEVEVALEYFQKWYGEAPLQLLDQLQYSKSGELELLTTVDMAMQEILKEGREPDVQSVKEFIKTTPKWKKKLKKPEFTESGIEQGIQKLEELFAT